MRWCLGEGLHIVQTMTLMTIGLYNQPEGVWLREYLSGKDIPYFAFRRAVPGKATGAHIHLGPMSTRYRLGG